LGTPRCTTRREIGSESIRGDVRLFQTPPRTVPALCLLLILALAGVIHAGKHSPAKPIDLNAANAKELQELPGVGPVTAQRIIDLREKSGRFKRVEDLLAVRGISQKKLDAMRPYVTVSAPPSAATPPQKAAPAAKKPSP
jgi:competence ComEA-like helix-hairpin-helix protein